jgi:hypothetical protein
VTYSSERDLRASLEHYASEVQMSSAVIDNAVRRGRGLIRRRYATAAAVVAVIVAAPVTWQTTRPDAVVTPAPTPSATTSPPSATPSTSPTGTPSNPFDGSSIGRSPDLPYVVGDVLVVGDERRPLPGEVLQFVPIGDVSQGLEDYAMLLSVDGHKRLEWFGADGSSTVLDDSGDAWAVVAGRTADVLAWTTVHETTDSDGFISATYALHAWDAEHGLRSRAIEESVLANAAPMAQAAFADRVVFSYAADPGGAPWQWDFQSDDLAPLVPGMPEMGNILAGIASAGSYALIDEGGDCWASYRVADGAQMWHWCEDAPPPDVTGMPADAVSFNVVHADRIVIPAQGTVVALDLSERVMLSAGMTAWEDESHLLIVVDVDAETHRVLRCERATGACELAPLAAGLPAGATVTLPDVWALGRTFG